MTLSTLMLLAALAAAPASAAPLVLDFTGTVTSAFGIFAGQGSQVVGTLHLDDALVASGSSTPNFDEFRLSSNQGLDMFMRVQVGTVMRSTEGNADPPFTLKNIQQHDGPTADIWLFDLSPDLSASLTDSEGRIELRSNGASDALLPGSGGLTGTVLVPTVGSFASATGSFGERATPSVSVSSAVFFDVDTLTIAPEPTATASTLAALAALSLGRYAIESMQEGRRVR